ncbi:MAG: DUF4282 domain-containing protein [Synergistaceae bacterium]|nr:DUF4282 domain-containing protein [Synergistota bacterium]NLM71578.1 DUF4282 domain-containing protein [Synergistaceae bacterium]
MDVLYDFLTFRYFISHNVLHIIYFLGAAGIPFLTWRLSQRLQSWLEESLSGVIRPRRQALDGNQSTSHIYGLFFLMFVFMEIAWRVIFEFLMAFLQMREALMMLIGM